MIAGVIGMDTGVFDALAGRADGPLAFRLVMQPVMASLLAIRAGVRDARLGTSPFLLSVLTSPEERRPLLRSGWQDISKVFVLAVVMDWVYQLLVFRHLVPFVSLLIATLLAVLPYLLLRGVACRLARLRFPRERA